LVNELPRETTKIALKAELKTAFSELRQGQSSWLANR
jgi:hypothetical protein